MSSMRTITNVHIRKLDHVIGEIRKRSLENVISKLDLGFDCECNAIKRELLVKLFKWFSIEPVIDEERVLDLLIKLLKSDGGSYLNCFGKTRFLNEVIDLRRKVDPKWHHKLNLMEEIISKPRELIKNYGESAPVELIVNEPEGTITYNHNYQFPNDTFDSSSFTTTSPLESSVPFELTVNGGDGAVISRRAESSVKWLAMPWQVLASSDKGVFASLESSLRSTEYFARVQACEFITNIMLQDFPAEVLLQRPSAVNILLLLMQSCKNDSNLESRKLIIVVLKTLYKLTRSLRFRLYYYCDPSIAHKAQKILARNWIDENCEVPLQRASPEGEPIDNHNQGYQAPTYRNKSPSVISDVDDSVLQLQQMFIPDYCTETLINVLKLLSIPSDTARPLKIVRFITDLVYELVQLLITSIVPTVWFCNDNIAMKIHDNIKTVFELLSEILDYFAQFNKVDHYRTTYIYFLWISIKLMSNIIPLELADQVIPKKMKVSICMATLDAPIYLMFSTLHVTLQEYARKFRGPQECDLIKLLDETRLVTKSMKAAISMMKSVKERTYSEELKIIYSSKLSLMYHKNFKLIRKFMNLAQNKTGQKLSSEDKDITTKITLALLAHNDNDVQEAMYIECYSLISAALGTEYNGRYSWKNIVFLLESTVLTEIICHGTRSENKKIKKMAEETLTYLLNGKNQMADSGWSMFIENLIPVLPLLQCLVDPSSLLGKSITKMLDPDYATNIKLPLVEVLKGNIRLLFSPHVDIRDEAINRLLWLLAQEKNATQKLPRLSSLNGLPLGSLCIFDKQSCAKRPEGTYQKSALTSVLDLLDSSNIEPKIRKSALVQVSVMMTDPVLVKLFISENGLPLLLDIFSKALIEKDFSNYPDSVISIITILKLLASSEGSVRIELSNRIDVYYNILRSLFLYPNNESIKLDGAQLLALLLYNGYIMRLTERCSNNPFNISLPYLITVNMKLPFTCKAHWKTSVHRRSDISIMHRNNPIASVFIRQFWAWEWNDGEKILWKKWEDINDPMIAENLMIRENELACLTFTSFHYCIQHQLYNIQNSVTHNGVSCAIDYLAIYMKLYNLLSYEDFENVSQLPWAHTFERFLQSYPTNKDDHELFVNVLNFLHLYIKLTHGGETAWLCKSVKNMMKSLNEWLSGSEAGSEDVYQSVLKLIRGCSMIETGENDDSKCSWIHFVEFAVTNLHIGEYYNLAFLAGVLSTLTYVIGKCQWKNNQDTLMSIGNALIELIISFNREGSRERNSFMALTNTRDCIICLNHVLHEMQINLNKNLWMKFWYDEGQSLSWLPALWRSRDPLVRASALQLLASLINGPHTALQLLNAIDLSPGDLCHSLLYFITAQEESCIVKEEACLAMSNLIKNSNTIVFQYVDALKPSAMLSYMKENNVYHEIAVMCSNIYTLATLDPDMAEISESEGTQTQSLTSGRSGTTVSMVPKTIYYLYDCGGDFQGYSAGNSEITDDQDQMQFITTPNLITALCSMLNNLITIGEHEVISEIFEHSLYKHFVGCFGEIPKHIHGDINLEHYCSILEMYTNLCTVLTNCVIHSPDFASIVIFSPEFIRHLFELLNENLYYCDTPKLIELRNHLGSEIFKFLTSLATTENQHIDSFQAALESCNVETLIRTINNVVKNSKSDLGISALGFLAFLLSQEMQKECEENKSTPLKDILDTKYKNDEVNKQTAIENPIDQRKNTTTDEEVSIGADVCRVLVNLFIAFNYAKLVKKNKQSSDKDVITVALTNLLCVSTEAKRLAIAENFPNSCFLILKEMYVKLNAIPIDKYKSQIDRNRKMHPLFHEIDSIYIMLMNFMYDSTEAKEIFARAGLADIIHKLWAYTAMNKKMLIDTLKLISTFTSNCLEASHSLSLTTITPGVGLRRTPNSVSLIHVIVQLVVKEIDAINRNCNCQKLNFAFQILRNAIHSHECRVVISKTNLLQFFTKIHPSTTKRTKLWQVVEMNCLEFLIDFTFYDEGQLSVSKAVDSLEVLINLARLSTGSPRLLAISILRNLAFNSANRPRLLGSADFLELLHSSLKEGSITEIEIAGSTLWSLISNNQKGKLIARSAGFPQCIQTAISRLSLTDDGAQEQKLMKMLEYVVDIISPR